jgi:hypothetical protein
MHRQTLEYLLKIYEKQLLSVGFPKDGLRMAKSTPSVFPTLPVVPIKNTKEVDLYVLILAAKHPIAQKLWNSVIKINAKGQRSMF